MCLDLYRELYVCGGPIETLTYDFYLQKERTGLSQQEMINQIVAWSIAKFNSSRIHKYLETHQAQFDPLTVTWRAQRSI